MSTFAETLARKVENHRCYSHPIFDHWATSKPDADTIGALFHQIQKFCASTRPGWNFPTALKDIGLASQGALMQEIVESESNHGPELATMAGHIVNRAANATVLADVYDQKAVEAKLKTLSDTILGTLPGYDSSTGLATQTRRAIEVFERRKLTDESSTYKNLGSALALEIISNRHLIPGEKHCLVDSGTYNARLDEPEMHYLLEHWGEVGAEQQHEKNAMEATGSITDPKLQSLLSQGADEFLDSLTAFWDLLSSSLLQSGCTGSRRVAS